MADQWRRGPVKVDLPTKRLRLSEQVSEVESKRLVEDSESQARLTILAAMDIPPPHVLLQLDAIIVAQCSPAANSTTSTSTARPRSSARSGARNIALRPETTGATYTSPDKNLLLSYD